MVQLNVSESTKCMKLSLSTYFTITTDVMSQQISKIKIQTGFVFKFAVFAILADGIVLN